MLYKSQMDFFNYLVLLFIVTGWFAAHMDATAYGRAGKRGQKRSAKIIGWLNIALGVIVWTANWIYQKWILFG